jgi:hypothetical protein
MKDGVSIIAVDEDSTIITTHEYAYALGEKSFEIVSG